MSRSLRPIIVAIISSVLILGSALGYITYRNFHREAELTEKLMFDKGITIIRSLEAGARFNFPCLEETDCWRRLQDMTVNLARENDLDFLTIFDTTGKVLAHSDPSMLGKAIPLSVYMAKHGNPGSSFTGPDTFVVGSLF